MNSKEIDKSTKKWGVYPNPDSFKKLEKKINKSIKHLKNLKKDGMMSSFDSEIIDGIINTLKLIMEHQIEIHENDPIYNLITKEE